MTAAEHGRNLAILDASFTSSVAQHNMNMFDIALNKFGADLNARANAMLRPENYLIFRHRLNRLNLFGLNL